MKHFPCIYVEVVGRCNARCPYCETGRSGRNGGTMDVGMFSSVVDVLLREGVLDPDKTPLHLYNVGEPFLHPDFAGLVDVLDALGVGYGVSTNASLVPRVVTGPMARRLKILIFSMPGFSQASYDRIHGFDFQRIKQNVRALVEDLRSRGSRALCRINYHVYQFNLGEMEACEEFAANLGVGFYPYYAIPHWTLIESLARRNTPRGEFDRVARDIFLEPFLSRLMRNGRRPCADRDRYFMISERAEVGTCCILPPGHPDYSSGNLLKEDFDSIMERRQTRRVCEWCEAEGPANIGRFERPPEFWRPGSGQAQLFYDTGRGFNERDSVLAVAALGTREMEFDLTGVGPVRGLRFDPLFGPVLLKLHGVTLTTHDGRQKTITGFSSNADSARAGLYEFSTDDPQVRLRLWRPLRIASVRIRATYISINGRWNTYLTTRSSSR